MRKGIKMIIALITVLVVLIGTTFAAEEGLFNGFKVVNVVVDGNKIAGDVPAINFYGKTMVPIKVVGEALKATITWDAKTNTAIINSAKGVATNTKDMDLIKLYSRIANYYNTLEGLSRSISDFSNGFANAFDSVTYYNDSSLVNTRIEQFNQGPVKNYNDYLAISEQIIKEAKQKGIDITDSKDILDKCEEAIDYYTQASDYLKTYANNKYFREANGNSYLEFSGKGFDSAFEARKLSYEGYNKYYQKTQE